MAQQSVTRVTGLRSGCHHKTFQLVIANINVAARYTRAAPWIHTHDTAVLTRPSGTRARVPGTRTLLFPASTGWKATLAAEGWHIGASSMYRYDSVRSPLRIDSICLEFPFSAPLRNERETSDVDPDSGCARSMPPFLFLFADLEIRSLRNALGTLGTLEIVVERF